ncbi:MAG: serine/threonine protein kinase [Gemmataceae bacterium]|nr:serine/threonine protein kinase [Gemmataceae bacterium]
MTERTIFLQALEQATPAERATFVEQACGGDAELRQRIEALLRSHEQGGSFLDKPAPHAIADGLATPNAAGDTQPPGAVTPGDTESLDFLAPSDRPGALGRLGHYDVLAIVGKGGMGIVLKAFDRKLHRVAAIKVLAPALAANPIARQRFTREVRAAAAVTHQHVVTIHTVEEEHRPPYLVMELVEGVSLQQRLNERGALAVKEVLRVGMQVASGLAAAHAHGLIHRDVKPANILLESGGEQVKLTDFGLARAADDASLTQTGVIAGTPAYMSPEQAEGKSVDHRSDLFSLGSVLYAMCTGQPPFRAPSSLAVLKRVCEETQTPIRDINPEIPDWLAAVVDRLHAKDPADRFQSAAEVADLLAGRLAWLQYPAGMPEPAAPSVSAGQRSRRARRRRWTIAAAVMTVLVAGLGLTEATGVTRLGSTLTGLFIPDRTPVTDDGAAPGQIGAFVLLADGEERKFDTLAEAVAMAGDSATIEVRGNGPFVSDLIEIKGALTIRAADGVRPVIQLTADEAPASTLLRTSSPLVLEGLELRRSGPASPLPGQPQHRIVLSSQAGLYLANCRFVVDGDGGCIAAADSPACHIRNCEFVCAGRSYGQVSWRSPPAGQLALENSVIAGEIGVAFWFENRGLRDVALRMVHNTLCVRTCIQFSLNREPDPAPEADSPRPVSVEAIANVVDARKAVLLFDQTAASFEPPRDVLHPVEAEKLLRRLLGWREQQNLYPEAVDFLNLSVKSEPFQPSRVRKNVGDWQQFWGLGAGASLQGRIRCQGGDVLSRLAKAPESIRAAEFRLQPDGAGYQAGKAGRDLGANVDLVGPGEAYERWKESPEHQEWRKVSGQVK